MSDEQGSADPYSLVKHWIAAIDDGDLEAIVACFDPRCEDEAPARRGEHVRSDDRVRENFVRLHQGLAELRAALLDCVVQGSNVRMEWRLRGRRADGTLVSSPSSTVDPAAQTVPGGGSPGPAFSTT